MMIYVKNTIAKSSPLQSQPKAAALLPSCTLNMALTSPLFTIRFEPIPSGNPQKNSSAERYDQAPRYEAQGGINKKYSPKGRIPALA